MENYEKTSNRDFISHLDVLHLHVELNNELEKFHQYLTAIKKKSFFEQLYLEDEKQCIMNKIKDINKRINDVTTVKRQDRKFASY